MLKAVAVNGFFEDMYVVGIVLCISQGFLLHAGAGTGASTVAPEEWTRYRGLERLCCPGSHGKGVAWGDPFTAAVAG